ncbi:hypothetical protein OAT67_08505 [Bacteriovoracaceae bacterium]|nr:hypothetical protein [Bacteriovoracaceae bacterium]
MWHPSISSEMKKKWQQHFKTQNNFERDFQDYAKIRKKYYKNPYPTSEDIFGPTVIANNFFSNAFYHNKSVSKALIKLKKKITKSEYDFLVQFLKKLMKPIFEFVKESTTFNKQVKMMEKEWKKSKAEATYRKLLKFVGIKKRINLMIRPVWWPANEKPRIDVRGNIVLLRYHPLEQKSFWDPKEVLEAVTAEVLASLSPNSRENMTKIFTGHCSEKKDILKLSLTQLWSRIYFSKLNHKKKFTLYRIWSENQFVDVYIKMLFPLLEETLKKKGTLEGTFIDQASAVCAQLTSLKS